MPGEKKRSEMPPWAMGLLPAIPISMILLRVGTKAPMDPDSWWIAAAGRWMLEHGRPPTENLFSFVVPEFPWVMHEWGLGVAYALGLSSFGPVFFAWLAMANIWCVCAVVGYVLVRDAADERGIVGMLAVLIFGFAPYLMGSRPSSITLLYLALMAAMAFAPRFRWGALLASTTLAWIWANTHGSFPLGLGLLTAGVIGMPAQRGYRIAALGVAAAVSILNPYGLDLHALALGYATGQSPAHAWIHANILEFQPIWGGGAQTLNWAARGSLAILLVLALRTLVVRKRAIAGLAFLTLFALGLPTVRYLWSASMVGCALLVPLAPGPISGAERKARRQILATLLIVPLVVGVGVHLLVLRNQPQEFWLAQHLGGPELTSLIARLPDGAHVLAPMWVSSRVIWEGEPRGIQILYDFRNDCYPPEVADTQLGLDSKQLGRELALELLRAYPASHALVDADLPLHAWIRAATDWERVAESGNWELWRRVPQSPDSDLVLGFK